MAVCRYGSQMAALIEGFVCVVFSLIVYILQESPRLAIRSPGVQTEGSARNVVD